jgi:Tol biopolymer transport system component
MNRLINCKHILSIRIRIRRKEIINEYVWLKEIPIYKTFLGIKYETYYRVDPGIYNMYALDYTKVTEEQLLKDNCYLENSNIYSFPYIELIYVNKECQTIYFKTENSLDEFISKLQILNKDLLLF